MSSSGGLFENGEKKSQHGSTTIHLLSSLLQRVAFSGSMRFTEVIGADLGFEKGRKFPTAAFYRLSVADPSGIIVLWEGSLHEAKPPAGREKLCTILGSHQVRLRVQKVARDTIK